MSFCEDLGLEHKMLAATIAVNEELLTTRPAAMSPEEIDQVLKSIQALSYRNNGQVHHVAEQNGHMRNSTYLATD